MSKKYLGIFLFLIILAAILIRTYHYNEWLFFKWDQARDAILLAPAIQHGPEHLPLLGPRATKIEGDYLRLGPIYYYIQYFTGVIFNSIEPAIFAYSDLFFSILTILLLYAFLRIYFNRKISLLGTLLYSFSFLVVQYSRFSWNPNSVPFFTLATFYALLRFSSSKLFKNKLKWLIFWAISFAVASQYHFFAFFVLAGVSVIFFLYYFISKYLLKDNYWSLKNLKVALSFKNTRKLNSIIFSKNSLIYILSIFLIFTIIYSPVIISDFKTKGSNTKLFFKMFSASGRNDKTFSQKIIRNFREQGDNYCLIATGFKHRPGRKADPLTVGFGLFLIISLLLIVKNELSFQQEFSAKRNFLILLIIWVTVFFIITIPASYQLRPRYFVPVFLIPSIIIAFWLLILDRKMAKYTSLSMLLLIAIFLGANFYNLNKWFKEQANSQKSNFKTYYTLILKHRDGVTLGQLKRVVNYLNTLNKETSSQLYYTSPTEYYLPFIYLFAIKDSSKNKPKPIKTILNLENKKNIFVINTGKNKSASKELSPYLKEISSEQFGQLFVHKMEVINKETLRKTILVLKKKQENKFNNIPEEGKVPKHKTNRLFWRDIFGTNDDLNNILINK